MSLEKNRWGYRYATIKSAGSGCYAAKIHEHNNRAIRNAMKAAKFQKHNNRAI